MTNQSTSTDVLGPIVDFIERAHRRELHLSPCLGAVTASLEQLPAAERAFAGELCAAILERRHARAAKRYERRMARLREQTEALESDAMPQAEVNAAVRRMFHDAGLD